jgi:hypothetical protein
LPSAEPGTLLTWRRDAASETLWLPARAFKFTGGPTTPLEDDRPLGMRLPVVNHTLTWRNVARVPEETVRRLRGTLNNATFLGAPRGGVLFLGARTLGRQQFDGSVQYEVEYLFRERTAPKIADPATVVGHNWFYYPPGSSGEHWFQIVNSGSGAPLYAENDLTVLFRYGP